MPIFSPARNVAETDWSTGSGSSYANHTSRSSIRWGAPASDRASGESGSSAGIARMVSTRCRLGMTERTELNTPNRAKIGA